MIITVLIAFICLLAGLSAGYAASYLLHKKEREENKRLAVETERLKAEKASLSSAQEMIRAEAENIANRILKTQGHELGEKSGKIMEPLKQELERFGAQVRAFQEHNIKSSASMEERIKIMDEAKNRLTEQTEKLAAALSGNKKLQGNWGEVMTEQVLQAAGLQKGIHYDTHVVMRDEDGREKEPDFVINLHDDRKIIIDSKVSLNAYTQYVNSTDPAEKERALKLHTAAVRKHIESLSSKEYQKLFGEQTPDFVVMFFPLEHAYIEALNADPAIYDFAAKNKIAMATASSIFAMLRVVENLWKLEDQNRNVKEIARLAGSLYDKLHGFMTDMQTINIKLSDAQNAYDEAAKKLALGKGNAVSITERIKKLGAKTDKELPSIINENEADLLE